LAFSEPLHTLVVDGSDAFLASMVGWIASRPDLRLVGTARSGPKAIEAIKRLSPDLVILDAVLPEIDGFRLTRMLKKRSDAPLIVLATFYASTAAREEAHAAGADAFLAKHDFADGFEAILAEWAERGIGETRRITTTGKPTRRGSRNVPDP
jgi:CheY-like chemotaxis protein